MVDERFGPVHAARVTGSFSSKVAIKCYVHADCSHIIAEWRLPSLQSLRHWVATAEHPPRGAPATQVWEASAAHRAAMRVLVDEAVKPGRTRASLIDDAASVAASSSG